MIVDSIYFKGHTCFKNEWSGFDTIKPINVIIGGTTPESRIFWIWSRRCAPDNLTAEAGNTVVEEYWTKPR